MYIPGNEDINITGTSDHLKYLRKAYHVVVCHLSLYCSYSIHICGPIEVSPPWE